MHTLARKAIGGIRRRLFYVTDREKYTLYKTVKKMDRAIGKKAAIDYVPTNLVISITFRCNLRCPGCFYILQDPKAFEGGVLWSLMSMKAFFKSLGGRL